VIEDSDKTGDRFRLLFNSIGDPMAVVSTDAFTLIDVNPIFTFYFGDRLTGKTLLDLMHPEDICRTEGRRLGQVLSETYRFLKKNGEIVWLSLTATSAMESGSVYVIAHDVTTEKRREQELFRRAHYDIVTGLPNRHLFEDRVRQGIAQAKRANWKSVLLFIDLDKFKTINDTYGHASGDTVLKQIAARLLKGVRGADTVCRYAGDEFVVFLALLREANEMDIVVKRLSTAIQQPIEIEGAEVTISASFGSAVFPDDGSDIEKLLTVADEQMYRHKTNR
jgi:diguanylate cyclase (GGDEF)-like protein/PAS domain S-box-containing protein